MGVGGGEGAGGGGGGWGGGKKINEKINAGNSKNLGVTLSRLTFLASLSSVVYVALKKPHQ